MKHITAFIGSLGGGGAQGVFLTVMNRYARMGYTVDAIVGTLSNDVHSNELDSSINIIDLGVHSAKESLPKLVQYIRRNKIELAFAFSPELAVNVIIARSVAHKKFPVIGRCINMLSYEYRYAEGKFRRLVTNKLVKAFYKRADCVVAQAERMREDLIENFGFLPEQVKTINNPLGDKYCKEIGNAASPARSDTVLYVGRFEKQKGLDMLLKAFRMVADDTVELVLVGNGSQEASLLETAKQLSLEDRVEIVPFQKHIEDYYKRAKLVVLSSIFEGFPNVLSEAIACGTPVVSFDLPSGPSDIIVEGVNGFLANYLDIEDLARKIELALEKEWDYADVKKTAERFSAETILPKYIRLIEEIEEK